MDTAPPRPLPPKLPPQSDPGDQPLSADDRLVLMMAGIIAATLTHDFNEREFNGVGSPRFLASTHRSIQIARALVARMRRQLEDRAKCDSLAQVRQNR